MTASIQVLPNVGMSLEKGMHRLWCCRDVGVIVERNDVDLKVVFMLSFVAGKRE